MSDRPHTAIIYIKNDIHPINNLGECDGRVVSKRQTGLSNALLTIHGDTLDECVEKTRKLMDEITKMSKM